MYVFNTLEVGGHKYTQADIKGIKSIKDYKLEDGFYGGRVERIGLTDSDILLFIDVQNKDGELNVIDTGAVTIDNIPVEIIRKLLNSRKIQYHPRLGKEKLIALLEGRKIDDD